MEFCVPLNGSFVASKKFIVIVSSFPNPTFFPNGSCATIDAIAGPAS